MAFIFWGAIDLQRGRGLTKAGLKLRPDEKVLGTRSWESTYSHHQSHYYYDDDARLVGHQ